MLLACYGVLVRGRKVMESMMRSWMRGAAFAAMLFTAGVQGKDPAKAEITNWPIPWDTPRTLIYDAETVSRVEKQGKLSGYSLSSVTRIEGKPLAEGYQQLWSDSDARYTPLSPDPISDSLMKSFAELAAHKQLVVDLEADGSFAGLRNLDDWVSLMRGMLETVLDTLIREQTASLPEAKREAATAAFRQQIGSLVQAMSSPAFVQSELGKLPALLNDFAGGGFTLGTTVQAETEIANPLGGEPYPARLQVAFSTPTDAPDQVLIRVETRLDAEKSAPALRESLGKLMPDLLAQPDAEREFARLLQQMSIGSDIEYRIDRRTGIVHYLEFTEFKQFPGMKETETTTLRLRP